MSHRHINIAALLLATLSTGCLTDGSMLFENSDDMPNAAASEPPKTTTKDATEDHGASSDRDANAREIVQSRDDDQKPKEQAVPPFDSQLFIMRSMAEAIASVTPTELDENFDFDAFRDLDLGGVLTTTRQRVLACQTFNYEPSDSTFTVHYNCDDLETETAPSGSIDCRLAVAKANPATPDRTFDIDCHASFATSAGELESEIRAGYYLRNDRMEIQVDAHLHGDTHDDIVTEGTYLIEGVQAACPTYDGTAAVRIADRAPLTAEITTLQRCEDLCIAQSASVLFANENAEFTLAHVNPVPPASPATWMLSSIDHSDEHYAVCQ